MMSECPTKALFFEHVIVINCNHNWINMLQNKNGVFIFNYLTVVKVKFYNRVRKTIKLFEGIIII